MSMKQLEKLWRNLPAESMMYDFRFNQQSKIQGVPKEERNARSTSTSTITRCFEDACHLGKFPDNGMEECTVTSFSSIRPKQSGMENDG